MSDAPIGPTSDQIFAIVQQAVSDLTGWALPTITRATNAPSLVSAADSQAFITALLRGLRQSLGVSPALDQAGILGAATCGDISDIVFGNVVAP